MEQHSKNRPCPITFTEENISQQLGKEYHDIDIYPNPIIPVQLKNPELPLDSLIFQTHSTAEISCQCNEQPYTDANFPTNHITHYHVPGSLSSNQPQKLVWERISALFPKAVFVASNWPHSSDILPGNLRNCPFLDAVASVIHDRESFRQIIPTPWPMSLYYDNKDTRYEKSYFAFHFWKWGKWVEVAVDDRLPFLASPSGELLDPPQLAFSSCRNQNEFWLPLLEKAYAKMNGSYAALENVSMLDAMIDLTGGVFDEVEMRLIAGKEEKGSSQKLIRQTDPWDLTFFWGYLEKLHAKKALIWCTRKPKSSSPLLVDHNNADPSINLEKPPPEITIFRENSPPSSPRGKDRSDFSLQERVLFSHSFLITEIRSVEMNKWKQLDPFRKEKYRLIGIFNPFGDEELWREAWREHHTGWGVEWPRLPKDLTKKYGEKDLIWIEAEQFLKNFSRIQISLQVNGKFLETYPSWKVNSFFGQWEAPHLAGGCLNHDTWFNNPQYSLKLKTTSFVFIFMQQIETKLKPSHENGDHPDLLSIGFHLFKVENNRKTRIRQATGLSEWHEVFSNTRQVSQACSLDRGRYVIVPCTFHPNFKGEFLLKVITSQPSKCAHLERDMPKKKLFSAAPKYQLSIYISEIRFRPNYGKSPSRVVVRISMGDDLTWKTPTCAPHSERDACISINEGFVFYLKKLFSKGLARFEVCQSGTLFERSLGGCDFSLQSLITKINKGNYSLESPIYDGTNEIGLLCYTLCLDSV